MSWSGWALIVGLVLIGVAWNITEGGLAYKNGLTGARPLSRTTARFGGVAGLIGIALVVGAIVVRVYLWAVQ